MHNTLNTSFGPQSQSEFDAGGLRYGQNVANLDFSREYSSRLRQAAVGRGRRRISPRAISRSGRATSNPGRSGRCSAPRFTTTAANCTTQGGVFNAGTGVCSFPGRAGPGRARRASRAFRTASATDASRHSYAAYAELDTDPFEGFTTTLAGRLRALLRLRHHLERQVRRALGADPRLCAARLDLQRLPRAVAPPAILHDDLDQLHQRLAGRHRDAGGEQPGRAGARLDADSKPEKSINLSFGATANPVRGLTFTADYYQIKIKNRIVLTENLGAAGSGHRRAVNAAVKAMLDANGFQSVGAARFFINGLDTTTQGIDVVAAYRFGAGRSRQMDADRGLQLQQDEDRQAAQRARAARAPSRASSCSAASRASASPTASRATRSCSAPTARSAISALTARTTRYGKVISPGAARRRSPNPTSLTALGPDDIFLGAKWITDLELRLQGGQPGRARDRRRQCVRRLSRPLAVRPAPGVGRRGLSGEPDLHSLFGLLAVRLQRPLPLRPRVGQLLTGGEGRASAPSLRFSSCRSGRSR